MLLRYVNAGMTYHSMSLLGGSQNIVAYDGIALKYPHKAVAETFGPGQTARRARPSPGYQCDRQQVGDL